MNGPDGTVAISEVQHARVEAAPAVFAGESVRPVQGADTAGRRVGRAVIVQQRGAGTLVAGQAVKVEAVGPEGAAVDHRPGRPLAGVPVRVVDADGNELASAMSGDDGAFTIDVAPGSYLLTASIEEDPARSVKPVRVQVRAGEVVRADVLVDSGIR